MATYEPGKYLFRVTGQGFGESKEKHTPFFFLEGEPVALLHTDGQQYSVETSYLRSIKLYITDKTADTVAEKLKALGWTGSRWSELDLGSKTHHSFVGQEIEAKCIHEPSINGDGKMYDKWELPYESDSEPMKSDPMVASKLDAMFGKSAGARQQTKAPSKTTTRTMQHDASKGRTPLPADMGNEKLAKTVDDGIPF